MKTPSSGDAEFTGTERFRIERKLGVGGMGVVYQVRDRQKKISVALKTIRNLSAEAITRFKQEFRALQDVQHTNLVSFGELHEEAGLYFFTMELVDGVDFLAHVCPGPDGHTGEPSFPVAAPASDVSPTGEMLPAHEQPLQHPFDEERLRAALGQLAQGVNALHMAGKIHRDIKPPNIRVTPTGRVVLLDFGLVADARHGDSSEQVVGTTAYMAPEQAAALPSRPEADWYSVGVILYQALTGRLPFIGSALKVMMEKQSLEPPPPRYWNPNVPEDLERLCRGLLRRDPKQRWSGREVLRQLGQSVPAVSASSSSASLSAPFVGRAVELARLRAAYDETRHGRVRVVLVEGDSGVGKSALVARFTEELLVAGEVRRPLVLAGRCYEREAVSYKAFDGVIESLVRHLRTMPAADAAAIIGSEGALAARVFPVLRRIGAVRQAILSVEIPNPTELRVRAFAALRQLFQNLTERAPLIVCIDDLQWADADSMNLLAELLREPEAPPLLLLATLRTTTSPEPGDHARERLRELPRHVGEAERLRLPSLPPEEARQLAAVLCKRSGMTVPLDEAALAQEAGGHPLFLNELVRYAAIVGVPAVGKVRLDDALYARIERLDEAARRLLDVVAVAGSPVPLIAATGAAALEGADVVRCTSLLRVAMLARTTGTRSQDAIDSYHDRVRESVLAHLDDGARRALHARLADALEAMDPTLQDPHLMVRHLTAAGMTAKAAQQAERAAQRAAETLAFDRAAEFYRTALELGTHVGEERRRLQVHLAHALRDAGRCAEAALAYLAAGDAPDLATRLQVRLLAAEQFLIVGEVDRGLAEMRGVLAEVGLDLPATPRGALVSLAWQRLRVRLRGLRWEERDQSQVSGQALRQLEVYKVLSMGLSLADVTRGLGFQARGLLLALKVGSKAHVARSFGFEAVYWASKGRSQRARAQGLLAQTRRIADESGDPFLLAWSEGMTGAVDCLTGEFATAAGGLREAERILREQTTGTTWQLNHVRYLLLLALRNLGHMGEVARRVDDYLRDAENRGDQWVKLMMPRSFAGAWLSRGLVAQVRAELARTSAGPRRGPFVEIHEWSALRAQAEIDLYEGNGAGTRARVRAELDQIAHSLLLRPQIIRTDFDWALGRLALAEAGPSASPADARRALAEADRRAHALQKERVAYAHAHALLLHAGAAARRGQESDAVTGLRQAIEASDTAGLALCAATARRRLGALLGGDEGRMLVGEADARMAREAIVDPVRMTELYVPGFGV